MLSFIWGYLGHLHFQEYWPYSMHSPLRTAWLLFNKCLFPIPTIWDQRSRVVDTEQHWRPVEKMSCVFLATGAALVSEGRAMPVLPDWYVLTSIRGLARSYKGKYPHFPRICEAPPSSGKTLREVPRRHLTFCLLRTNQNYSRVPFPPISPLISTE